MSADALTAAGDAAITADLEDIAEGLRASLGRPKPTDEERARDKLRWNAQRTAKTCGQCGRDLEPDEAVWRTRIGNGRSIFGGWRWTVVPLCRECKRDWPSYSARKPCEACGRPVANEIIERGRDYALRDRRARAIFYNWPLPKEKLAHWFCSERCAKRCYRAKERERRAEQRLKECAVCGETFEATRSDAKTCSPACRQKAYRRRTGFAPRIRNAETDAGHAPNIRNADGRRGVHLVNVTGDAGRPAPRHRDIRNAHGNHDAVAGGAS